MVSPSSMAGASGLASAEARTMSMSVRGAGACADRRNTDGIPKDCSVSDCDWSGKPVGPVLLTKLRVLRTVELKVS